MVTPAFDVPDTFHLPKERPSRRIRLFFWVILGAFSVFFAEVTVGSSMFPFFDPFSILVTCPLYALHRLGPSVRVGVANISPSTPAQDSKRSNLLSPRKRGCIALD